MKIETPILKHKRPATGKKRRLNYKTQVTRPPIPLPEPRSKKNTFTAGGGFMVQRHHAISVGP
jgi:hypothetical protein